MVQYSISEFKNICNSSKSKRYRYSSNNNDKTEGPAINMSFKYINFSLMPNIIVLHDGAGNTLGFRNVEWVTYVDNLDYYVIHCRDNDFKITVES